MASVYVLIFTFVVVSMPRSGFGQPSMLVQPMSDTIMVNRPIEFARLETRNFPDQQLIPSRCNAFAVPREIQPGAEPVGVQTRMVPVAVQPVQVLQPVQAMQPVQPVVSPGISPGFQSLNTISDSFRQSPFVQSGPFGRPGPFIASEPFGTGPFNPAPFGPGPFNPAPFGPGPFNSGPFGPGPFGPGPVGPFGGPPGPFGGPPGPFGPFIEMYRPCPTCPPRYVDCRRPCYLNRCEPRCRRFRQYRDRSYGGGERIERRLGDRPAEIKSNYPAFLPYLSAARPAVNQNVNVQVQQRQRVTNRKRS